MGDGNGESEDGQLIDKYGLAERWGITPPERVNRLRRKDPPPPAARTRPRLLFDPQEADEWAREHGPDDLDVPPPPDLVDKHGLAERLGVSENTVRYYRHKRGMPEAGRGDHNRVLYDPEECIEWLMDQGIIEERPGARGTVGSRDEQGTEDTAEQAASGDEANSEIAAAPPGPRNDEEGDDEDSGGETGMEEMVRRERQLERRLYEETKRDPSPANLKAYKKVAQERRLAEKALREEKEARGELIPRSQHEKVVLGMAAWLKREIQGMPETTTARLVDALAEAGEVENPREVSGSIRDVLAEAADEMLRDLRDRLEDADAVSNLQ